MAGHLTHELTEHFPEFARFHSTQALEGSALFQELQGQIQEVLAGREYAEFCPAPTPKESYKAVAWNIERGRHYKGVRETLATHPELNDADIYLLTESDIGMARSQNMNIARNLAEELGLNYYFATSYINLSKGCGHEKEYEGENTLGLQGNTILSRYPLSNFRSVELPCGKDKMKGNEKRIGKQRALVADVELGDEKVTVACIHLDAHSSQDRRMEQLGCVLDLIDQDKKPHPVLIGGDWNTTTYNSSKAVHAIIGFWVRVGMGIDNMIRNHYPHPDHYWEKKLFNMLETRGFDYKSANKLGAGTLNYDIKDPEQEKNLKEWVPDWCFRFIEWSLRNHDGRLQFKLDWFAGRELATFNPQVVETLVVDGKRCSDHEAITTEFKISRRTNAA